MDERNVSAPPRVVQCKICTILIGEGFEETQPIPLPNGSGSVCWGCFESLRRQAQRRAAEKPPEAGG